MAVSLNKGQGVDLRKAEHDLSEVTIGLGWDVAETKKGFLGTLFGAKQEEYDLDAIALVLGTDGKMTGPQDAVFYNAKQHPGGAIWLTGDNRTGEGDGDDEQIIVNLTTVPANVKSLVFTVNSFTGQNFSQVDNATCRIVNASNNQEVARFNLSTLGNHNSQIMVKLYRHNGEWKIHAIGETGNGRTFGDLISQITPHL